MTQKIKKSWFRLCFSLRIESTLYSLVLFLPSWRIVTSPIPIPRRPAWPVCGVVEKCSVAALKFQLNNYAWRRALKRRNERALLTIKNKKGAATERKERKEQQGSGRKRRNMSAVNNTLREIILRERPLTVTNNGSLSLSFFLLFCFPCILSAAPSPLCCLLCGVHPYPFSIHTPALRIVYIPHAFFRDPPCARTRDA